MRKTILTVATFLALTNIANAKIKLGVQAGASVSQPTISTLPNATSLSFLEPGIVSEIKLANFLNFRPSLNYLRTGFNTNTAVGTSSISNTTNINNVHIPLDLAVPIKLGSGRLILCAGPSINYALSGNNISTTTVAGIVGSPISTALTFGSTALKSLNWGTNFGLGYQLKNGIDLKANYNLGVTDQQASSLSSYKNNTISLLLSYFILK